MSYRQWREKERRRLERITGGQRSDAQVDSWLIFSSLTEKGVDRETGEPAWASGPRAREALLHIASAFLAKMADDEAADFLNDLLARRSRHQAAGVGQTPEMDFDPD